MPSEARILTATQYLLTTLVVKLAVVAVVATMLVRFRQFRRILLTEQRAWRERLVFAISLGVPLSGAVVARLLLNYDAADLSLAGPFLAGLIAGPYAGAMVGGMVGAPALLIGGEAIALPFAVGCGFAGGGLREVCPKEAIWHLSPLFFTDLHRHAWRMIRFKLDWLMILLLAPIGLELLRLTLGARFGNPPVLPGSAQRLGRRPRRARHRAQRGYPDQDLEHGPDRTPFARAGEAAHVREGRSVGESNQPPLPVQYADLDLLADFAHSPKPRGC